MDMYRSMTMSASMSLIVGLGDSMIINTSVRINLNASSSLGVSRYMNINTGMAFE